MSKKSIREKISIIIAKNPAQFVLTIILVFNIVFLLISAAVISYLAPSTLKNRSFWASVYYTISMVLDAGCIGLVIEDVGSAGVGVILACIAIVIIGMITFTGAVIGYVTNYISEFITSANRGDRPLRISDHTVIVNWNSRASEIINDMLYTGRRERVVVLVSENKDLIEREINDRLEDTIQRESEMLQNEIREMSFLQGLRYSHRYLNKRRITVIVREGDAFSNKKLNDISIKNAKAVIILAKEISRGQCEVAVKDRSERYEKGNADTIKTLIQIAEQTGDLDSADDQKVIVEVNDPWTMSLVNSIIAQKEKRGKCNIVPVSADQTLGQLLSQFSIMPELNMIYAELFSNKGATFYSDRLSFETENYEREYLKDHYRAIPLTELTGKNGVEQFYMADEEEDLLMTADEAEDPVTVRLRKDFWLEKRHVVIVGHNSNSTSIMNGFDTFQSEWNFRTEEEIRANGGPEILDLRIVDDPASLKKHDYYRSYSYVTNVIEADVYDKDIIIEKLNQFIDEADNNISILILSDDTVPAEEIDANALTYLIYVQDIISERKRRDYNFDPSRIDVIVEIINPKNYDIVHSYSIDYVVISNRYISKMMTQISEKEDIFYFYQDILTYDTDSEDGYTSKELYVKQVGKFLEEIPGECSAAQLIRAVYDASPEDNRSIVLGYIHDNQMILFYGDQRKKHVALEKEDKLIIFTNH